MPDCLLASQSPRRRELLSQIGVDFAVVSVDVAEEKAEKETGLEYVERLAREKSQAGVLLGSTLPVIGSDTIVILGEKILEKPQSQDDALTMLSELSNCTHQVITAVAISDTEQTQHCHCISDVTFREITQAEAIRYWQTGEPKDKAGGYGIQGLGAVFVKQLQGSYSNVVGLPLYETTGLLTQFAIPFWKL